MLLLALFGLAGSFVSEKIHARPNHKGIAKFKAADGHEVRLAYSRYGRRGAENRVMMIMGCAATQDAWQSQVDELISCSGGEDLDIMIVRAFPGNWEEKPRRAAASRVYRPLCALDSHFLHSLTTAGRAIRRRLRAATRPT